MTTVRPRNYIAQPQTTVMNIIIL